MKNITSHILAGVILIGTTVTIAALNNAKPAARVPATTTTVAAPAAEPTKVDAMKACAEQAQLDRARWFFDETGMMTTPDSGAAQRYANLMEAQGLTTNTPIPSPYCE